MQNRVAQFKSSCMHLMTKGSWPRREFPQPSNHITALYALCSSPPACWKKNLHICPQKAIASEYKCCHAKATQARWQKIGVKKCFYTSSTKSPFLSWLQEEAGKEGRQGRGKVKEKSKYPSSQEVLEPWVSHGLYRRKKLWMEWETELWSRLEWTFE